MALPVYGLRREVVTLPDGHTVEIRSLSRVEVLKLGDHEGSQVEGEVMVISWATGLSDKEVLAWLQDTPSHVVQKLVNEISRISHTEEDSGKGSSEG